MADVYIALGSNIGDRKRHLLKAINKIHSIGEIISIAPLYLSSAYGFFEQPDFYNSIVLLKTKLEPLKLLNKLKLIEVEVGRKNRIRWGPREIDLDIIFYNQEIIETNELTVPHPDFKNRSFVLQPLKDIASELKSPKDRKTVAELLNNCKDDTKIELISKNWFINGS